LSLAELLEANYPLVERVIAFTVRRHRLSDAEADELASLVRFKLVEHDYAILRKFEERSSLRTYLVTVVERIFLDQRVAMWGKWRPTAEARRLGPTAVRLEMLLVRDGLGFDEACELLRTNHQVPESQADLDGIRARLPLRPKRHVVGEEALAGLPARDDSAEQSVLDAERHRAAAEVQGALAKAVAALPPQDRLIVRLLFDQGLTVAQVARSLNLDQKALYRRRERLLDGLRQCLLAEGIRAEDVADGIGAPGLVPARPVLVHSAAESGSRSPSL
jgi:RNA polymerase sigma factor (sigma-70 family)